MPAKIDRSQSKSARGKDGEFNRAIDARLSAEGKLAAGATGKEVQYAERMLLLAGFNPGKYDATFDAGTTAAIKQFQAAVGLGATGEFDAPTFKKLKQVQQRVRTKDYFAGGQRSGKLKAAEERLKKLGYDTGRADGVFDQRTGAAVSQFRKDQKAKHTGPAAGQGTLAALAKESKLLSHAPYRLRRKPTQRQAAADKRTTQAAARKDGAGTTAGFGKGESGPSIKNVQLYLKSAGFDPKREDGVFDARTEGALKAFQRQSGLKVTGKMGPNTWKKLSQARMYTRKDAAPAMARNEKSGAVKRLETLLKRLGHKPGKIDGHFTQATEKAVRAYENRRQGIKTDGKVSEGQLKAMKKDLKRKLNPPSRKATAYVQGRARSIRISKIPGNEWMRTDAARAYTRMLKAASRAGVGIFTNDGFRTMSEQRYLYNLWLQGRGNRAAPPGYSNHQNGIAVDIGGVGPFGSRAYNWLARNAGRFGFSNAEGRGVNEPWHWVYVR